MKRDCEPATFVKKDFYVDNGLRSVPSATEASALIKSTKSLLAKGGFNLHKFISNSKEVIEAIPKEQRASGIKELDLSRDILPIERAKMSIGSAIFDKKTQEQNPAVLSS